MKLHSVLVLGAVMFAPAAALAANSCMIENTIESKKGVMCLEYQGFGDVPEQAYAKQLCNSIESSAKSANKGENATFEYKDEPCPAEGRALRCQRKMGETLIMTFHLYEGSDYEGHGPQAFCASVGGQVL